ncbi:MAG TPA: alanine--glyoxylate aminotransferase family protein [Burkholderiales bacterium]|nr:alanine--glyoxylate aminotransferase family protein [Burkholderiales bacterium]
MEYRLRLPGPTTVPERVRRAGAAPMQAHRGAEFKAMLAEVQGGLRAAYGTAQDVFLFAGSGTAMMEASLANVLAPGDAVLVAVAGQFSERFAAIAAALGAEVDVLDCEWGQGIDVQQLAERVRRRDYRAVVVVHNESSTGVTEDLAAIGAAVRERPTLLVVDSVSGLAGTEMKMDAWGADIVVSASQKCLMCPPGLGFAAVSAKAWERVRQERTVPRFFWDFRRAKAALEKGETAFTTPVSLVYGLREALAMIAEEGLANVIARHRRLSSALRAGCRNLGLEPFNRAAVASSTVVAVKVPQGLEGAAIVAHLRSRYGTVIAGSRSAQLHNKVIRIGTMGAVSEADIETDLAHLEATLKDLIT